MLIQPYLFFDGNCEEAVEFYRKALGAEVEMLMRYRESPEPPPPGMVPPGWDDKVMHTTLRVGGAIVMASDGPCSGESGFRGFSLSISVPDTATAEKPTAGRSRCRSARPSGRRASACCETASGRTG